MVSLEEFAKYPDLYNELTASVPIEVWDGTGEESTVCQVVEFGYGRALLDRFNIHLKGKQSMCNANIIGYIFKF